MTPPIPAPAIPDEDTTVAYPGFLDTLGLLRDVARGEQDRFAGRVIPQDGARQRILARFAE